MKKLTLTLIFSAVSLVALSQRPGLALTFTAVNVINYLQLDSIKVMNRTQGGDTVLYWPDTVLSFNYVGMPEIPAENCTFRVFQNYPNPVSNQTKLSLYVPEKDRVSIIITDIIGRMILDFERILDQGENSFLFQPGSGNLYFFSGQWRDKRRSIKIVSLSSDGGACSLEYLGSDPATNVLKAAEDTQEFDFSTGDQLLCIGYSNTLQSGILDSPEENTTYTFQFATNIPCPGTPTVDYEGQVYNTIQIFSQCWLKDNLNVGEMIPGTMEQSNNGTIEKYCYNNEPDNCTKYGGLYQWDEMMQYTTQLGSQGICPPGWHAPTDEEWKGLEGAVDSQYGIGDPEWDNYDWRGFEAAKNLKTTSGWYFNGNGTDLYGFSGLPAGSCDYGGYFNGIISSGTWWTSTESGTQLAWIRSILDYWSTVNRFEGYYIGFGFSARCLRDE